MLSYNYLVMLISAIIFGIFIRKNIRNKYTFEGHLFFATLYFCINFAISRIFFPIPVIDIPLFRGIYHGVPIQINLQPFHSVRQLLALRGKPSTLYQLKQIVGNVILFIPLGYLMPVLFDSMASFRKAILTALIISLSIESFQYIVSLLMGFTYRIADIDDLIYNVTGTALGFGIYVISFPLLKRRFHLSIRTE